MTMTIRMMMMMMAMEIIRKWLEDGCIVDAAACSVSREGTGTIKHGGNKQVTKGGKDNTIEASLTVSSSIQV